jgi:hypothetical protein
MLGPTSRLGTHNRVDGIWPGVTRPQAAEKTRRRVAIAHADTLRLLSSAAARSNPVARTYVSLHPSDSSREVRVLP